MIVDHVFTHSRRIAFQRIAEASARGPDDGVNIFGLLREVLLTQLQRYFLSVKLCDIGGHVARAHPSENIGAALELVGIGRCGVAAHHARRRRDRVARRQRVVHDRLRAVRDEARLRRKPTAITPCATGIHYLLAIQKQ